MTAKPISFIAAIDASKRVFPSCMCRHVFSRTTMESSTIMPTEIVRASSVNVFRENPIAQQRWIVHDHDISELKTAEDLSQIGG